MRNIILTVSMMTLFLALAPASDSAQSKPYTPVKGSTERKAILDAIRQYRKAPSEVYTPTTFNVGNGFSVVYARDPNDPDVDTGAIDLLLRKTGKVWKVVADLMPAEGVSAETQIKSVRRKYPAAPAELFKEN